MNDREIDERLNSARPLQGPNPETLERIAASVAGSMHPVRPLPAPAAMASAVASICALVALAGGAALGFAGIAKMSWLDRCAVFSALALLVLAAANQMVSSMIPGSRRRVSPGALLAASALCLITVLAFCFRDYQTTRFLHAGIVCLSLGLLHAIPAGLLSWLVLRRGYAVNRVSAGLAAGTLAGLAGVGMLELHCPNFEAPHVLVWHTGVLLVSAALGALWGWGLSSIAAKRQKATGKA